MLGVRERRVRIALIANNFAWLSGGSGHLLVKGDGFVARIGAIVPFDVECFTSLIAAYVELATIAMPPKMPNTRGTL